MSVALLTISLLLVSCGAAPYECTDPLGCLEISPGSPVVIDTILATIGEQGRDKPPLLYNPVYYAYRRDYHHWH